MPTLSTLILLAGFGQLSVLAASALVPLQLDWKHEFASLSKLHRQMYWVYGGYVVLGIVSLGLISIACHDQLASGTPLARAVCGYAAAFWGIRLALQAVLDAKPFLTKWWLVAGYHLLTMLFVAFTAIFAWATFAPAS
ncbi:hypothetical protein NG895_13280 [Aeoliella sp. ICT_H6.2]|uniref:Uncharacterized protein n=1 Tax=Aeoliella straminimaris TaxID=2954799 RepID=A0A9X2JJD7_9BACT|nr:hypothetical protein [Aeoliella straminimaris]MCO6044879.1 hypothetical protein [Aeoliella straminimaris]